MVKTRDTPGRLSIKSVLNKQTLGMAGSNAGKKRNRLRAGVIAWKGDLTLDPAYGSAIETAAAASGSWAASLYMQRLLEQIAERDSEGNVVLPVLSSDLATYEEVSSAAA